MNAFTVCSNTDCQIRSQCRRSLGGDDPWQSTAYFTRLPNENQCFGFVPIRVESKRVRWEEERSA
jgi:hypothetical protein